VAQYAERLLARKAVVITDIVDRRFLVESECDAVAVG
jgi:hypothetical protein